MSKPPAYTNIKVNLMDSDTLCKYGFKNWYRLRDISSGEITPPSESGVYVLRLNRSFGRLKGESDILYIGSTSDIYQRIVENYLEGRGGKTTQRIRYYIFDREYLELIEISWVTSINPKQLEEELLKKYEEEHHELPPWNRTLPSNS